MNPLVDFHQAVNEIVEDGLNALESRVDEA